MFTLAEVEICLEIFGSLIKEQRERKEAAPSDETDSRLMQLISINNKLTDYHESQSASIKKTQVPKVLIVDDVDEMQAIVDDILYKIGFTKVVAVHSAEKAISVLKKAVEVGMPFKIVMTDDDMDGKSGIDLLKEIRLDKSLSNTDVFIMSTNSAQEKIVEAMNAGVSGYILKPLNYNVLEQKLLTYLKPKTEPETNNENANDSEAKPVPDSETQPE